MVIPRGHWACSPFPAAPWAACSLSPPFYRLAGAGPSYLSGSLCFLSLGLGRGLGFHILRTLTAGGPSTHLLGSPPSSCCLRVCPALGEWESPCEVRGTFCIPASAPTLTRPFSILSTLIHWGEAHNTVCRVAGHQTLANCACMCWDVCVSVCVCVCLCAFLSM